MRLDIETVLQGRRSLLLFPAVALVALMLRSSFTSGFYTFDDMMYVYLADRTPVSELFTPKRGAVPLTLLSWKLDRAVFGPQAETPRPLTDDGLLGTVMPPPEVERSYRKGIFGPAARIMNALYHFLAGVLLWLFLNRIRTHAGIALIVALAWIGHPTACESVCWVSERKNVLAALFCFATLYAWGSDRQWRWRWPAVCALFACALGSKPSAVGLLPVLTVLEIIDPIQRRFNFRATKDWALLALHMFVPALLTFGAVVLNIMSWRLAIVSPPGGTLFTALLTDCEVFGRYAMNAFLPVKLSFFYCIVPVQSLLDTRVYIYGIPLLFGFAASIAASRPSERHLAVFGTIWFFSALSPNANLVSTYAWMQDRYLYLALPGVLLAGCYGVTGLASKLRYPDRVLQYVAIAWMAFLAIRLEIRAGYFIDTETLELNAADQEPRSAQANLQAGYIYRALVFDSSPGGKNPDPSLLKPAAMKSSFHFQTAIDCPDRQHFVNPLKAKLACAEVLIQVGENQSATHTLEGFLPPPGMKLYDNTMLYDDAYCKYTPDMLAHGWALLAESLLRQSLSPVLPVPERDSLLNRALDAVGHSIEVSNSQLEGTIVRAKVLLQMSLNETEKHDLPNAEEHFQLAVSLLRSVPAGCPNEKVAKFLLDHAKPPK